MLEIIGTVVLVYLAWAVIKGIWMGINAKRGMETNTIAINELGVDPDIYNTIVINGMDVVKTEASKLKAHPDYKGVSWERSYALVIKEIENRIIEKIKVVAEEVKNIASEQIFYFEIDDEEGRSEDFQWEPNHVFYLLALSEYVLASKKYGPFDKNYEVSKFMEFVFGYEKSIELLEEFTNNKPTEQQGKEIYEKAKADFLDPEESNYLLAFY